MLEIDKKSSSALKFVAFYFMILDHIGLFLFPDSVAFRLVGRFSFPIYLYLIALAIIHSKSFSKYLFRLFICWGVTDFALFFCGYSTHWNIIPTLAICAIYSRLIFGAGYFKSIFYFFSALAIDFLFDFSYGIPAILITLLFLDNPDPSEWGSKFYFYWVFYSLGMVSDVGSPIQLVALGAAPIIKIFSDDINFDIPDLKYWWYLFYPLHFAVIRLIGEFL